MRSSLFISLLLSGCVATVEPGHGGVADAGTNPDAARSDASGLDASAFDASAFDAAGFDASAFDAAMLVTPFDAATDAIPPTTALLVWTAVTVDVDGNPLTNLAGYYVYHGLSTPITTYNSDQIDVGNVLTYTFTNLPPGMHYFAVSAYTTDGTEGDFSMTGEKTVP